ncbi:MULTISPECIES: hypothetical protein [Brachyspira]|uniref:Uncharacterized protein n=2 Tax=Brachyspira TaxID=29521 RepID=A0AAC9XL57_9SPIR|nr:MULTISPECIES: hypothetical protein [Brachyspira]ADG72367.1 hypothetical protein Bmur_2294 [Brachyspira murdochii DSM 12563]ASJ22512.1 hypothetical protein BHAMNSH16_13020 [Brachyspira hampsonii]ELV05198.1 hypothetical protein H263_11659 [Brachyspira hampsonii 30599]MBW5379291.1 hypothetical protein [Brachyspira hampsonii]OEJ17857.1 hypothetical protein A9496_10070 [Brachyspira hampsonii]
MAELEKFSALYGKIDYPADLLTTPFEVLEYRTRLGLTTSEFEFICWIFHLVNKDFNEIRDKDISRRCTRQRKSLQAKGYLKIKIARTYKDKRCIKVGLVYDFTNLKNKIEELKEEDKKLQNLEAPVTVIYDEPSLFNEDVDENPIYPAKLLTDDKEIKELQLQNEFLEKFKKLYEELLLEKLDYSARAPYKMHLIKIFKNRVNNNIDDVLEITKNAFYKLPVEKRYAMKLQDLLKMALCQKNESTKNNDNKENKTQSEETKKYTIPSGIDKLNYLLKIIEEGGNLDDAYSQIANCG